jgi:hypothetical protein
VRRPGRSKDASSYCADLKAERDTAGQVLALESVDAGWADDLGLFVFLGVERWAFLVRVLGVLGSVVLATLSEMTFRGLEIWDLGIMPRVGVRKVGEIDGLDYSS